ncbi:MAG: hypothetical protein U5L95_01680 [Candidatus Saccharibacteria bacterium]|nr:hypothetical protein [Candidatus Saccharibacteria bacterium]
MSEKAPQLQYPEQLTFDDLQPENATDQIEFFHTLENPEDLEQLRSDFAESGNDEEKFAKQSSALARHNFADFMNVEANKENTTSKQINEALGKDAVDNIRDFYQDFVTMPDDEFRTRMMELREARTDSLREKVENGEEITYVPWVHGDYSQYLKRTNFENKKLVNEAISAPEKNGSKVIDSIKEEQNTPKVVKPNSVVEVDEFKNAVIEQDPSALEGLGTVIDEDAKESYKSVGQVGKQKQEILDHDEAALAGVDTLIDKKAEAGALPEVKEQEKRPKLWERMRNKAKQVYAKAGAKFTELTTWATEYFGDDERGKRRTVATAVLGVAAVGLFSYAISKIGEDGGMTDTAKDIINGGGTGSGGSGESASVGEAAAAATGSLAATAAEGVGEADTSSILEQFNVTVPELINAFSEQVQSGEGISHLSERIGISFGNNLEQWNAYNQGVSEILQGLEGTYKGPDGLLYVSEGAQVQPSPEQIQQLLELAEEVKST